MDLKTVVYYAAMFLQLEDVTEALESDSEYIGETADEIDRLTRCANLVLSETAADYMPLKTREEIYCENGEMLFDEKGFKSAYDSDFNKSLNIAFRSTFPKTAGIE